MAFFNDQQKEETTGDEVQAEYVAGDQRLALMRSFETRLWELDVQVKRKNTSRGKWRTPDTQQRTTRVSTIMHCTYLFVATPRIAGM